LFGGTGKPRTTSHGSWYLTECEAVTVSSRQPRSAFAKKNVTNTFCWFKIVFAIADKDLDMKPQETPMKMDV
jgi:hypothetical protein